MHDNRAFQKTRKLKKSNLGAKMIPLERPLLSAISALLFYASAGISTPSPLNNHVPSDPITITNSSFEAQSGHLHKLTYAPWPAQPYPLPLHPRLGNPELIIIRAYEYHGTRPVSVPALQDFIDEFRDNLEREHPVPDFVPRVARQSSIDIQSYTMWSIEITEGLLGHRMPTEYALVALDELAAQLGSHGPASVFFSVREGRSTYSYGYLDVKELGGGAWNGSLVSGQSSFQTS